MRSFFINVERQCLSKGWPFFGSIDDFNHPMTKKFDISFDCQKTEKMKMGHSAYSKHSLMLVASRWFGMFDQTLNTVKNQRRPWFIIDSSTIRTSRARHNKIRPTRCRQRSVRASSHINNYIVKILNKHILSIVKFVCSYLNFITFTFFSTVISNWHLCYYSICQKIERK